MAQCYQCGSSVEPNDGYCMECGAEHPARQPSAATIRAVAPAASGINQAVQLAQPTMPTWLPAEITPSSWQKPLLPALARPGDSVAPTRTAIPAQEAEGATCPRCHSSLPPGARFCGDCGERMPDATGASPAPASGQPVRPVVAMLPDPIPPLTIGPTPGPAARPPQPVLPPFRASPWAASAAPEAEEMDTSLTALPSGQIAPAPPSGQIVPRNPGVPAGGAASANPARPAVSGMAPPTWAPGQIQEPGMVGSFQPPFAPTQGPGMAAPFQPPFAPQPAARNAAPSQAPFLQAMASIPPVGVGRRPYPRSQVIAMLVAALVTVMAGLGGILVLLLGRH